MTYTIGGSVSEIDESLKQLITAMIIAIILVFATMVLVFKEIRAPLALLFSLPFAFTGSILALYITDHSLSMSGLIGMLMLIGIVVTNAIVLLDRVITNLNKEMDLRGAILEAATVRLRPIIIRPVQLSWH